MNFAYLLYVVNKQNYNCQTMLFIILFIIYLLNISPIGSDENNYIDNSSWISVSSHENDSVIYEIFKNADLTEKINIIKELGARNDRDFNFFLESVFYGGYLEKKEKEYILYCCFDFLLDSEDSFRINRGFFEKSMNEISGYSDSLLRRTILEKTVYAEEKTGINILINEGEFLLKKSGEKPYFDFELRKEGHLFMDTCRKYDSPVLDQLSDSLYRNTANLKPFE